MVSNCGIATIGLGQELRIANPSDIIGIAAKVSSGNPETQQEHRYKLNQMNKAKYLAEEKSQKEEQVYVVKKLQCWCLMTCHMTLYCCISHCFCRGHFEGTLHGRKGKQKEAEVDPQLGGFRNLLGFEL